MIISHKYKFIFFCNGKTGTKTIEKVLGKYDETNWEEFGFKTSKDYIPYYQARHMMPLILKDKISDKIFNNYFKFTFVRNPWDWVISNYCWNNKKKISKLKKFKSHHFKKHWKQMKKFRGLKQFKNYYQYNYVFDKNNNRIVDYIGRFESLQEDFNKICEQINIPIVNLPVINKTEHKNYLEYYTPATIKLVEEKYRKDIKTFNYPYI